MSNTLKSPMSNTFFTDEDKSIYFNFLEKYKEPINNRGFQAIYEDIGRPISEWLILMEDLEKLNINPLENVIGINSHFFEGSDITKMEIPERVLSIGEDAFRNCRYLSSVVLPNSLMSIGPKAFMDCESLTNIIYKGTCDEWRDGVYRGFLWKHLVPCNKVKCIDGEVELGV